MPTYGRPDRALRLARALLEEPGLHELVVAVDGPDPVLTQALDALTAPRLVVVVLPENAGQAAAREAGARAATGDVLLLIDDDVELEPGVADGHARAHGSERALLVVGHNPVALPARRRPGMAATYLYASEYDRAWDEVLRDDGLVLQQLWAGHLSLRREDFLRTLGEPWPVKYHEDQDLGLRLRAAGVRGRTDASLRSRHHHERSTRASIEEAGRQGEALVLRAARWPDLAWPDYAVRPGPFGAVRALSRPGCAGAAISTCRALSRVAGLLHLWRIETAALRLARQVALRRALQRGSGG